MSLVIEDHVKETTTSTGTGALSLAGAMLGFQSFSSSCAVGDRVFYGIQAVDVQGSPSGDWECGLGTYSAANTLTRTTVTSSSNAGEAVSFSSGTKHVYITIPSSMAKWMREKLTSNRTYYVSTTGSDNADGLAVGSPFLTVQKAIDVVCNTLSLQGYTATIQIADGTYAPFVVKGLPDDGSLIINGNSSTPANVIISATASAAVSASSPKSVVTIQNLKVQTVTSGDGIYASDGAVVKYAGIVFGACADGHIKSVSGAYVTAIGDYSIVGSAPHHFYALGGTLTCNGRTITISGTPAFSWAFAVGYDLGQVGLRGNTYSGSATGKYYDAYGFGRIMSGTQLPGNSAGATVAGGAYN